MKLKLTANYNYKHRKGDEVEVDAIEYDWAYNGFYKVRVVGVWKNPRWLAIAWFVKLPEGAFK